jgi:hypothetical protein
LCKSACRAARAWQCLLARQKRGWANALGAYAGVQGANLGMWREFCVTLTQRPCAHALSRPQCLLTCARVPPHLRRVSPSSCGALPTAACLCGWRCCRTTPLARGRCCFLSSRQSVRLQGCVCVRAPARARVCVCVCVCVCARACLYSLLVCEGGAPRPVECVLLRGGVWDAAAQLSSSACYETGRRVAHAPGAAALLPECG